jgi:choline monooxygenase
MTELLSAFDPELPLERARTIPASWYTDAGMAQAERERVFGRTWCVVGRAEQVAQPGSFLTAEVAGWPILVVQDQEGVLRGFLNVCRHRAAPLLTEPCGSVTKLRCRYHGWTYDLAGRLRGTPEFDGVADFRHEDNGLRQIAVETWGPLVAVRIAPDDGTFAEHLAPMPERTAAGLAGLEFAERREYTLACNWKVYVDNYLDGGYHVNTVHPGLAGMLDYSQYRTETFAHISVQTSPLTTGSGSVRSGVAQYWFVFPNFMLNLYDGVMDTNLVLPLGPDHCRVVFDFYFGSADREFRSRSIATAHQIQQEDLGICEEVQRGLASGAFETGRFSVKREAAGYHFHQLLARCLRS